MSIYGETLEKFIVPIKSQKPDNTYYTFKEVYLIGTGTCWRSGDPMRIHVKKIYLGAGCFVIDLFECSTTQNRLDIYFPTINKLVRLGILKEKYQAIELLREHLYPLWKGPFKFFHYGVEISHEAMQKLWMSETERFPPIVCIGADKIVEDYRNYITEVSPIWDEPFNSKPIPLVIDTQIRDQKAHSQLLKNIREAAKRFEAQTPVRFIEIDEDFTQFYFAWVHIYLSSSNEILSTVGRSQSCNPIHLTPRAPTNAIMHELMHILGFVHEHQRQDRDLFVEVNNKDRNYPDFKTEKSYYAIGTYDPRSIMHYHFSELQPKENGLLTTQEKAILSNYDIPTEFSEGDLDAIEFIMEPKGNVLLTKLTESSQAKDSTSV
eukprot:CAMPEP_0176413612 /NCGR_PEP_ID=MMETSP0127-20121128/4796_1 /TAXON_ID=938130 /ORGANISM="Platyophrya macrostoma, Strain WH" /LENGTH=376 /DNA_ID=CAMNT_0017793413 /DNA_START=51 /DNA_END=1182 /DNA_ORIENTATION=+